METKHTPGPWRWELNEKCKTVDLVGGRPEFDKTVMGFARWGMGHAAPVFNDAISGGQFNILRRCEEYAQPVPGREHHAAWFKTISHPDAQLMAAAPDLLAALQRCEEAIAYIAYNYDGSKLDDLPPGIIESTCPAKTALIAQRDALAAIAKATGQTIQPGA